MVGCVCYSEQLVVFLIEIGFGEVVGVGHALSGDFLGSDLGVQPHIIIHRFAFCQFLGCCAGTGKPSTELTAFGYINKRLSLGVIF